MELGLTNKRALILGSSRGIGLGIAKNLVQAGAHVGITGRNFEQLNQSAQKLSKDSSSRVVPFLLDLFDEDSSKSLFNRFTDTFDGIDILVNNSGGPPAGLSTDASLTDWQKYFASMVLRLIELTNLCLPSMREQKWGRVLNISSSSVIQPIPGLAISNILRPSIIGWSKTLATEVALDGITVNTMLPGKILTERLQLHNQVSAEKNNLSVTEFEKKLIQTIPMGRFGSIEEFADVAAFYLSERASYLTGGCIRVDGGAISSI